MGEIRELIRDYMSPFNQNIFFKELNIIDIYNFNAIFRQPRQLLFCEPSKVIQPLLVGFVQIFTVGFVFD